MKTTLYDNDEFKLIQRVCDLRDSGKEVIASKIHGGHYDCEDVYYVEIEY